MIEYQNYMSICFYNVHEHTLCDTLNHQLDEKFASFNISTLCLKETEVVTIFILLKVICYSAFNQMTQFIIILHVLLILV